MNTNNNNSIYLSYDDRSGRVSWGGKEVHFCYGKFKLSVSRYRKSVSGDLVNRFSIIRVSVNGVSLLIESLLIGLVSSISVKELMGCLSLN